MNNKKETKNTTGSKPKVIDVDGFKMHLSEIEIELNNHEKKENENLIDPEDFYNKGLEDL